MVAILLDEEEAQEIEMAKKKQKKRSIWVHEILKKRKIEGEYATLCKQLEDHEDKFFKYFRMTKFQFNVLFLKIKDKITKQNTPFRESIPPKEKLAVCLSYY
ncbi:hypothetical protein QTP88_015927 [Uroleucon formosanum]